MLSFWCNMFITSKTEYIRGKRIYGSQTTVTEKKRLERDNCAEI